VQTKLQTFLEPAFANKKVFFLSIFTWLILGLFSFANILLIQKIVAIIEN
jgi:hypothetical protein